MIQMRTMYLMLFLSLTGLVAKAQNNSTRTTYRITFIKGEILLQKTQKALKLRDVLTNDDKIQFRTAGAKLGAVSLQGQRYMAEKPTPRPEYLAVWETFLHGKKAAADRGSVGLPTFNSLQKFFAASEVKREDDKGFEAKPFALLEKTSYKVKLRGFEQNEKQYFYLQFTTDDNKTIQRPLTYEEEYLTIKREDIEGTEGKTVDVFFQKEDGEKLFINQMIPVLIDTEVLKEELSVLLKYLGEKHPNHAETYANEIVPHIEEFYGKIDERELKEWLKTNLKFDIEK